MCGSANRTNRGADFVKQHAEDGNAYLPCPSCKYDHKCATANTVTNDRFEHNRLQQIHAHFHHNRQQQNP